MTISRLPTDQQYHDKILQTAADNLRSTGKYNVYTNPNGEHNTRLGDSYPDIILTPQNSNTVQFIIEVETSDSVNENEIPQWREYSSLGGIFYLLVPIQDLARAKQLCVANTITARFAYYVVENNAIKITYE